MSTDEKPPTDAEQLAELLARPPVLTRRPTVAALEERMFHPVPVLDHGFIRLVDYSGDEAAIVQAARVSYGKGTKTRRADRGLIRYMLNHGHTSPFEMCELKLHVKLPIFVARQWIRHRTANVNEYSARYSILDKEFYIPEAENLAVQSTTNRQGRAEVVTPEQAKQIQGVLRRHSEDAYSVYEDLLNEADDDFEADPTMPQLARELARIGLTLNHYTQWYWKIDLHNLLHFLRLRCDPHAQYEIRVYADAIAKLVEAWVPNVWEAFVDYRLEARTFSRIELTLVRELCRFALTGQVPAAAWRTGLDTFREGLKAHGATQREVDACFEKLDIAGLLEVIDVTP